MTVLRRTMGHRIETKRMTSLRIVALLALCGLALAGPLSAQESHRDSLDLAGTLDARIPALLAQHTVTGVAIGLVEQGEVRLTRGYGCADCERGRAMTDSTLLNLASVSKSVTAWALVHLAEQNGFSLDAPVESLLPEWPIRSSRFARDGVTLRRLLSHTAGLSMPSVPWFPADSSIPTRRAVLLGQGGDRGPLEILHEPGTQWSYSGGGYMLLEWIIEEMSGRSFPDYVQRNLFDPLGMKETTFAVDTVSSNRLAIPYDDDGDPIEPYRLVGVAAGGLYSTARDFARFVAAYAGDRETRSDQSISSRQALATMLEPIAAVQLSNVDVDGAMYGLGHNIYASSRSVRIVYHSGGNPGFIAYFLVVPETGNGLVILSNSDRAVPVVAEVLQLWARHYDVHLPPLY